MKKLILIFFVFHYSFSFAQFQSDDTHFLGKFSYGTVGAERYNNYSLQMELFLGDYFSVNYNFDLSYDTDNVRRLHTPLGLIGGPPLIIYGLLSSNSSSNVFGYGKGGAVLGLLLLIAPDGFGLHIPIRDKVDISPYANILGLDFIRDRNTNEHWIKYSASFGTRITYLHKSGVTLSVFAEGRKAVRFDWMKGIGFGVGYYF